MLEVDAKVPAAGEEAGEQRQDTMIDKQADHVNDGLELTRLCIGRDASCQRRGFCRLDCWSCRAGLCWYAQMNAVLNMRVLIKYFCRCWIR